MSDLVSRVGAAQATLDQWRGKPFKLGRADCARVAASHLRRSGRKVKLPASGSYGTVRSAMKKLAELGYADMLDALDKLGLERIPPAAALPGDLIAIPTGSPLGCITVVLSNGRVAGYHDDVVGLEVLQPVEYVAAWRV